MAGTVGPTAISYIVNPRDGSMTITGTQAFADGSTVPLQISLPAYKVSLFYTVIVAFINPAKLVVPNGAPSNADVARLVATFFTIINSPPPQSAPVLPAMTSVPDVAITP